MENYIRTQLEEFYTNLFIDLEVKYPDADRIYIKNTVDSVVEESLDWDGSAY